MVWWHKEVKWLQCWGIVWDNHSHTHTHDSWSLLTCGNAAAGRETSPLPLFCACFEPVHSRVSLSAASQEEDGATFWRADKCCSTAQSVAKSPFVSSQIWTLCDTDNTETKNNFLLMCAFYDVNCSLKVLWDLETFCHLNSLCVCVDALPVAQSISYFAFLFF